MSSTGETVRDGRAMLAGLTPKLTDAHYVFCTTTDPVQLAAAERRALLVYHEDEGTTLILTLAQADELGFDQSMPMRRVVLTVFSALDGVGLTAGVATALAEAGIPCNVVAAFHHDHVFVPAQQADHAMRVLAALQRSAADR